MKVLDRGAYSLMPQEGQYTADYGNDLKQEKRGHEKSGTGEGWKHSAATLGPKSQFPFSRHFHLNPLK